MTSAVERGSRWRRRRDVEIRGCSIKQEADQLWWEQMIINSNCHLLYRRAFVYLKMGRKSTAVFVMSDIDGV